MAHSSTYSFSFQTDLLQAVHFNLLTNTLQNSFIKNLQSAMITVSLGKAKHEM